MFSLYYAIQNLKLMLCVWCSAA